MKAIFSFLLSLFYVTTIFAQTDLEYNIIPQPNKITRIEGSFKLNSSTVIVAGKGLEFRARQLNNYLEPATGYDIKIEGPGKSTNIIEILLNGKLDYLGEEGYKLEIYQEKIKIESAHEMGIFWGIQTLRQLLPNDILRDAKINNVKWQIPCIQIVDTPRFKWRGLMIDYSRTFWNKQLTKKYIDVLSFYKMNRLHMHLTDDQGWRIEIKKYPELTQIASKFDTIFHEPEEREGYYTQTDLRELITYAQERNVEIVPEIEMPGHSSEVFSVYPDLSCKGDTLTIHPFFKGPNIHKEIFCAGNDFTFQFLEDVLSEVINIFPSEYIHIGGDEAPKDFWKECEKCQQRIKDLGLLEEDELQSWFIKRIETFLTKNGKKMIGWDEIIEGGLSEEAIVMYWRSWKKEVPSLVAEHGNPMILSPTSHCYFDYTYKDISTEKVYSFNPVPEGFEKRNRDKILGIQANFWSHINRIEPEMDRQIFPRMIALSEVGWSQETNRNWENFGIRLKQHIKSLKIMDIYYFNEYK